MEDLFNILSSAARIDKSKRKKRRGQTSSSSSSSSSAPPAPPRAEGRSSHDDDDDDDDDDDNEHKGGASARGVEDEKKRRKNDRPERRHSAEKLAHIRREEMAAFRRRMGIRMSAENRHEVATTTLASSSSGTIPDAISSFGEWRRPGWWDDGDGGDGVGDDDGGGGGGRRGRVPTSTPTATATARTSASFRTIRDAVLANVESGKWTEPTPIQMQVVPCLTERRDVMGCAPTGSGKTGAFVLPTIVLAKCDDGTYNNRPPPRERVVRAVLLAPSRELASQLCREVLRLSRGMPGKFRCVVLSKSNAGLAIANRLGGKDGLDCLVSTPMRLVECVERGMKLDGVRLIVLDEADRLLDESDGIGGGGERRRRIDNEKDGDADPVGDGEGGGDDVGAGGTRRRRRQQSSASSRSRTFLQQVDSILAEVPASATRALFSATLGPSVRRLSESMLRNPVDVATGAHAGTGGNSAAGGASEHVRQELKFVGREEGKLLAMRQLVAAGDIAPPALVFLQSKERAQALYGELLYDGIRVDVIHAGRSHADRERSVQKFRRGDTWVLICTDLVARGVDFKAVNLVINYDLPLDGVSYVHRIGRTGRAGREGRAITFFTEADFDNLRTIANVMRLSGCEVPEWMLTMKKQSRNRSDRKFSAPPRRGDIDTTPRYDMKKKKRKREKRAQRDD
ncbi:hypothetical protein ACHAW5_004361 [Stephanodiscus triporus]|uniref:RNA helicase n=1 Tax=Stephanodiscus triporus TaxID=2934178 RepID=A0ABD3Q4H1_9STRA